MRSCSLVIRLTAIVRALTSRRRRLGALSSATATCPPSHWVGDWRTEEGELLPLAAATLRLLGLTYPSLPDTLDRVRSLYEHPDFSLTNPNRVRALVGAFAAGNPVRFHARDGAGYRFLADVTLALDGKNPQVASRMASQFSQWRRYDAGRREQMKRELERIADAPGLSKDVFEIVGRALGR